MIIVLCRSNYTLSINYSINSSANYKRVSLKLVRMQYTSDHIYNNLLSNQTCLNSNRQQNNLFKHWGT